LSPIELREVLKRLSATRGTPAAAAGGRVVAFISNKGGVGKSTLAVNVACGLSRRNPGKVLLIDASLQLGICALMLDLAPTTTIVDAAREHERLDETLLRGLTLPHESGLRLLAGPSDALDAANVTDEALARILNLARRAFDVVVVDTFPMIDSVVMAALDMADLVFIVFQGTTPGVAGTARLLPVLEGLGFSAARQRLVLNRNHKRFLGELAVTDMERRLGRPIDHVVPYEKGVLVSMNTGRPPILGAVSRWRSFPRAVENIVETIDQQQLQMKTANVTAGPTTRSRFDGDRRSGVDRRVRDVGRREGDRRSGVDRRAFNVAEMFDQEVMR
jgi:pilus assembly protein CpaE